MKKNTFKRALFIKNYFFLQITLSIIFYRMLLIFKYLHHQLIEVIVDNVNSLISLCSRFSKFLKNHPGEVIKMW